MSRMSELHAELLRSEDFRRELEAQRMLRLSGSRQQQDVIDSGKYDEWMNSQEKNHEVE